MQELGDLIEESLLFLAQRKVVLLVVIPFVLFYYAYLFCALYYEVTLRTFMFYSMLFASYLFCYLRWIEWNFAIRN